MSAVRHRQEWDSAGSHQVVSRELYSIESSGILNRALYSTPAQIKVEFERIKGMN